MAGDNARAYKAVLGYLKQTKDSFRDFQPFGGVEHSVQCLFFEIWRFMFTTMTEPITLPLVHVCGVTTCYYNTGDPLHTST